MDGPHLPWRGALRRLVVGVLALLAASAGADVDLADYDPLAAPKDRQAQAREPIQVAEPAQVKRPSAKRRAAPSPPKAGKPVPVAPPKSQAIDLGCTSSE